MFDTGIGIAQSWFCVCLHSWWVLYSCLFLTLVVWMAWKTKRSFSWRTRMALLGSRLWWRRTKEQGEGVEKLLVKQPYSQPGREHPSRARRATRSRSIRTLLCDNADCTLCNEAARQAEELVYTERASTWVPARPESPPSAATSPKGRGLLDSSTWRGFSVLPWCRCRVSPVWAPFRPLGRGSEILVHSARAVPYPLGAGAAVPTEPARAVSAQPEASRELLFEPA
nr:uncharacterized protein LOC112546353 [Pelodiscus sinensis]|eukprot:XP_025042149.1 uncharacterized protein LOC112546353 [Pelodiscus sinensis]